MNTSARLLTLKDIARVNTVLRRKGGELRNAIFQALFGSIQHWIPPKVMLIAPAVV